MDAEPAVPEPAGGITIRPFEPGRDERDVHRVIDEAFCEWPDRQPSPFEEWYQFSVGRDTFAPRLSPLAFDGDRLVGAALSLDYQDEDEGYVHQLAVHRDYRHRGIARVLLRYAFRGFYRKGRRGCVLSTNSYTGALSLYERVGMRIRQSYTHHEKRFP
jgi:ribosomal protein S18 acetylase RimI-like enzyme